MTPEIRAAELFEYEAALREAGLPEEKLKDRVKGFADGFDIVVAAIQTQMAIARQEREGLG